MQERKESSPASSGLHPIGQVTETPTSFESPSFRERSIKAAAALVEYVSAAAFVEGLAELCHEGPADQPRRSPIMKLGSISRGPAVAEGILIMAMKASELGIKTPCTLDWTKMTPAEGGRFCGDCKKVVRDLSSMTEAEARALVAKERYEGLCVQMLVDRDGNVFFAKDRLLPASLLGKAKRAAMAAAAIALPLASNACTAALGMGEDDDTQPKYERLMGGAPLPDDPPPPPDGDAQAGDAQADDASPEAAADGGTDAAPDVNIYK